jgi:hypothetical protein
MRAEAPAFTTGVSHQPTIWLSGEIITPLNKLIMPVPWIAALCWMPFNVLLRTGHIAVAPDFRLLLAMILIATIWMLWFSTRLCRVGYSGRELVISTYWREARVPFDRIVAIDSVWWYRRRLVKVELPPDSQVGPVVYYIPKWAMFRAMWSSPEKELRDLIG